ncbi:hypothetical protein [Cohnella sp. GCM10027633]|uniref:hypothetical protein n=1 Tax=unclassified Cohnella TaxID=2636738 RepID=UPI00364441B9
MKKYVEEENFTGSIIQLNLRDKKKILLNGFRKNAYFLGELIELNGGHAAFKITPTVDFGNTSGAGWTFSTLDKSNYNFSISADGKTHSGYFIAEIASYISIEKLEDNSEKIIKAGEQILSYEIIK